MIDIFNSFFQVGASIAILLNIKSTYKHKSASGISIISMLFYLTWGIWNIHYFTSLDQIFSLVASFSVLILNSVWIFLILKYRKETHDRNHKEEKN